MHAQMRVPEARQQFACGAELGELRCAMWRGVDAHALYRQAGGLGLPVLIHESACGQRWAGGKLLTPRGAQVSDTSCR
jgi:hypothetical protein